MNARMKFHGSMVKSQKVVTRPEKRTENNFDRALLIRGSKRNSNVLWEQKQDDEGRKPWAHTLLQRFSITTRKYKFELLINGNVRI